MTIPSVKESHTKEMAMLMRPYLGHKKEGKICLEAISWWLREHDPEILDFFLHSKKGIYQEVTAMPYMAYFLLFRAAEGKLPKVSSKVKDRVRNELVELGMTDEPAFKIAMEGEMRRIRENNELYAGFVDYVTKYCLTCKKEKEQAREEAIFMYNLIEGAIWSKSQRKRKILTQMLE